LAETTITIKIGTLVLRDVLDIIYTPITQDTAGDGDWVRELRFYGTPADGVTGTTQTLVVQVRSPTKENLEMTTAPLQI
jgi:hypothetical protein